MLLCFNLDTLQEHKISIIESGITNNTMDKGGGKISLFIMGEPSGNGVMKMGKK